MLFLYLKLSHKLHWFDKPNETRKLHTVVKPTAAGLVFIFPIVIFLFFMPFSEPISSRIMALILLSLMVIGGYDDFKPISAKLRFVLLFAISLYFIYAVFYETETSSVLLCIYMLGLIWWLNLYNFMDGADGMATLHAMLTLMGYALLYMNNNLSWVLVYSYIILILFCLFAFLLFNFPVAKMFMGDAGSLSVAFILAAFALYGIKKGVFDEILVISFHLVFIVDATLTLFTRLKYKHNITQAHNLHVFQVLIQQGHSHAKISLLYASITLILVSLTIILQFNQVNSLLRIVILLIETTILSLFWFKIHHKTRFKHFHQ